MVQLEGPHDSRETPKPQIVSTWTLPHEGNPRRTFSEALAQLNPQDFDRIAATGRRFRRFVALDSIPEPQAVEYAYRFCRPEGIDCPAVISGGGETFMVYVLDAGGQISDVRSGNKCAAGTGEFFLQQLRRMGVSLDEAARWAVDVAPYGVSGRCSVFCKSDCTHATNKGVPRSQVTAGLCRMMAAKILELLKRVPMRNLMLTGGTTRNRMMVAYLRERIPGLVVPDQAYCFEALGAALWALEQPPAVFPGIDKLFQVQKSTFDTLPMLPQAASLVTFKSMEFDTALAGDVCILGLDVGSTTTKAVLMRRDDSAILASIYLRTEGDPVGASRRCYTALLHQLQSVVDVGQVAIIGLGVCGSGRQIAGLHALTEAVYNEIVAHAAAAVFFDPGVDTLFEIGGQDAKYTYISNGVPADYAMNEACSAGTGSFLEESALETLGLPMEEIADVALKGVRPPNFNDQCAAFISSDIKTAVHEGIPHDDIVAGLVYSICMNYTNRVKGNRPVGDKILMQGGVCYNRAVPLAMATLVGKPIVVPPEPGLMGAFGVALEVEKRLEAGLLEESRFDLQQLAERQVEYGRPFVCRGGKEGCDRRCSIARIQIEGRNYPFGGACNRYDNLRHRVRTDSRRHDLVHTRQQLVYETFGPAPAMEAGNRERGTIGFNRSFMVNTFYPLYAGFFGRLGWRPVLPASPSQAGIDQRNAAFCYPGELAHGFFHTLLNADRPPDHIFLPHFKAVPSHRPGMASQVCPFVQGEPFYLKAAFRDRLRSYRRAGGRLFSPMIDLSAGLQGAEAPLVETAVALGVPPDDARRAFREAADRQLACQNEMQRLGREALAALERDPSRMAVVILARPYNGFVEEAHMGIPRKLASRGIPVLPLDFLPLGDENPGDRMYWGMGQLIIKAAHFIVRHPQLFATYITNFSCGPDSFLLGHFRTLMGRKPSLTLELDSHTADAGLDNRIEAFIDIVHAYRQLPGSRSSSSVRTGFNAASVGTENGSPVVKTSSGKHLTLRDKRVTVLLPSMGRIASEALGAAIRSQGYSARCHEPADEAVLKLGRANTSCKECLPLILTTGTLLNYVNNGRRPDEVVVYFMPTGAGPCRFGQYASFMKGLIERQQLTDVALFSLTSEDSYAGLGAAFEKRAWWAVVVSDALEDIRAMLLANAAAPAQAMTGFEAEWKAILSELEKGTFSTFLHQLEHSARRFRKLELKRPVAEVPKVALTGEIFVRRDGLSRRNLTEQLAALGFAAVCSPIAEWVRYSDYLVEQNLTDRDLRGMQRWRFALRKLMMNRSERRLKAVLATSGLIHSEPVRIPPLIQAAAPYISAKLAGEAILTIGASLVEVATQVCGVIAIGPFGCMPNRLAESVLNTVMNREGKLAAQPADRRLRATLDGVDALPFLAIESDGSPFPQLIDSKLETFCLRAERLHGRMLHAGR